MTIKLDDCILLLVDLQEKLTPHIHDSRNIANNCEWLIRVAQKLQVPTLACEQYPKGLGHTEASIRTRLEKSQLIEKTCFSAARNIIFIDKLAELNKSQIIICGIEAHVCVLQTAIDLLQMDYQIFVVADAIGSRSPDDKYYAIQRMLQKNVSIVTKEMVLFEWLEDSNSNLFKEISLEFLRSNK